MSNQSQTLTHFGVKGMKWGTSRAGGSGGLGKSVGTRLHDSSVARGEKKLFKASATGGAKVAIGGRAVGLVLGGASAGIALKNLNKIGAPKQIRRGAAVATGILQTYALAKTALDIADIHNYEKSRKESSSVR